MSKSPEYRLTSEAIEKLRKRNSEELWDFFGKAEFIAYTDLEESDFVQVEPKIKPDDKVRMRDGTPYWYLGYAGSGKGTARIAGGGLPCPWESIELWDWDEDDLRRLTQ